MKLYTTFTSPYGRKCHMTAHVAGIADRVAVTEVDYHDQAYAKINPLSKVPALERDDGTILIDSPVICAYLARQGDENAIYPTDEEARWQVLCLEALADGITDAGVSIFLENKRREEHRSRGWVEAQTTKIHAGLDAVEKVAAEFGDSTHIGVLAVAAAVSWMEFRSVIEGIRGDRHNLSAWLDRIAQEDFMITTAPPVDA